MLTMKKIADLYMNRSKEYKKYDFKEFSKNILLGEQISDIGVNEIILLKKFLKEDIPKESIENLITKEEYNYLKIFYFNKKTSTSNFKNKPFSLLILNEIYMIFLTNYKAFGFEKAVMLSFDYCFEEDGERPIIYIFDIKSRIFKELNIDIDLSEFYLKYSKKLKKIDVLLIREKFDNEESSIRELREEFNTYTQTIRNILKCKIYNYPECICFDNIDEQDIDLKRNSSLSSFESDKLVSLRKKFSDDDIFKMRNDFAEGKYSIKELAKIYNHLDLSYIHGILVGDIFINLGGHLSKDFFNELDIKKKVNWWNIRINKSQYIKFRKYAINSPEKGFSGSLGEKIICEYLTNKNIINHFHREYPISINSSYHYFDFLSDKYKVIIEFDGKQHFEAISIFGGDEKLKLQEERDQIKNDWAIKNEYKMLRIKYNDNIEDKLSIFFRGYLINT